MVSPGCFNPSFFLQARNLAALGENLLAKQWGDLTRAEVKLVEQWRRRRRRKKSRQTAKASLLLTYLSSASDKHAAEILIICIKAGPDPIPSLAVGMHGAPVPSGRQPVLRQSLAPQKSKLQVQTDDIWSAENKCHTAKYPRGKSRAQHVCSSPKQGKACAVAESGNALYLRDSHANLIFASFEQFQACWRFQRASAHLGLLLPAAAGASGCLLR